MSETKAPYLAGPMPWYLRLVLPLPPTTNRLYVRSRTTGQPVLSEAHRAYRSEVWGCVQEQAPIELRDLGGRRLSVYVRVRRARHRDMDNFCKALLDSLSAALRFDDRHIDSLSVVRHDVASEPEMVVMLSGIGGSGA